jgi:lipid II:glycine glycyltransferase (peptidoglycan interpeptide bridge formation enzyme)
LPIDTPAEQTVALQELSAALRAHLPANTLFIRFDPPWGTVVDNDHSREAEATPKLDAESASPPPRVDTFPPQPIPPARQAPANIQPPDSVILDLTQPDEALLNAMKSKWRYNIRLAEKKGVTIRYLEGEAGATEGVDSFYRLYLETAERDGIAIHSKAYYADLLRRGGEPLCPFDKPTSIRVYLAEHEGDVLASIITLFCGEEAVYLYGASSNEKRNLMPAYSLQWRAIRDARAAGCARYDFYGIPPEDDPSHPMYGLYRFKTGFGGKIIHRVGSVDLPVRPVLYGLYRLAETGRAFWFKKVKKLIKRETRSKS